MSFELIGKRANMARFFVGNRKLAKKNTPSGVLFFANKLTISKQCLERSWRQQL